MRRFFLLFILCSFLIPIHLTAQNNLPPVAPASVTGDMSIDGAVALSSATQGIIRRFQLDGYTGVVTLDSNGTTTGVQRFCSGEVDIVMADRQLTPQEVNTCTASGRTPTALRVATASVSVVVPNSNEFLSDLTPAELQQTFSNVLTWDAIRTGFPAQPIARFGTSVNSSAFQIFSLSVFGGDTRRLQTSVNAQYFDDRNIALQSLVNSEFGVGFFDSGFIASADSPGVKAIAINGVVPQEGTIVGGNYPLASPLFLYTSSAVIEQKPQVAEFLNYYLTNINAQADIGVVYRAPAPALQAAYNAWFTIAGSLNTVPVNPSPTPMPTNAPVASPTPAAALPETTEEPDPLAETTEEPIAGPAFSQDITDILIAARTDMELVANQLFGGTRPDGWSESLDVTDRSLPVQVRLNLELLATAQYGELSRPANWFGAVRSTQFTFVRDIRHDLEVLADDVYLVSRPSGWEGDSPLYSCPRQTQALVSILELNSAFTLSVPANAIDYCAQAAVEAAIFAETTFIGDRLSTLGQGGGGETLEIETSFAVGFFTRNASQRAGVVPQGEVVRAIARSGAVGSNMLLVGGAEYTLFIDFTNTNLNQAAFESIRTLESLEDVPQTFCDAFWCE